MSLAIVEPLQKRSQRTYDAILDAAERLLLEKSFDVITVAEFVAAAGVSTGSFYARFASKDALLPVLYLRYEEGIAERAAALSSEIDQAKTLADACSAVVTSLARVFRANPNLMRAMTLLARSGVEAPRGLSTQRKEIHAEIERAMLRFRRVADEENAILAIRTAVFGAVCVLREAILYPYAPFAAASGRASQLEPRIAAMMAAYLKQEL